jgi:hypothetical protein
MVVKGLGCRSEKSGRKFLPQKGAKRSGKESYPKLGHKIRVLSPSFRSQFFPVLRLFAAKFCIRI